LSCADSGNGCSLKRGRTEKGPWGARAAPGPRG
jgi:hypothetical protein